MVGRKQGGTAAWLQDGFDYDVLVIGSGFGGCVAALRLTEKGYRVGVLEAGRRFTNRTRPPAQDQLGPA